MSAGENAEQGVTIGFREIYDKVLETNGVVQLYAPRIDAVEKVAARALTLAEDADNRSKETKRHITWLWKTVGTLAGGSFLAFVGAWASKHVH